MMTRAWKRIEWGSHSPEKLAERGFRRDDVHWLLYNGRRTTAMGKYGPVTLAEGKIDGYKARLVFAENAERIKIVTVMWVPAHKGKEHFSKRRRR